MGEIWEKSVKVSGFVLNLYPLILSLQYYIYLCTVVPVMTITEGYSHDISICFSICALDLDQGHHIACVALLSTRIMLQIPSYRGACVLWGLLRLVCNQRVHST